jgi:hypothetical protein
MADLVLQDFRDMAGEKLAQVLHREKVEMLGETDFCAKKGAIPSPGVNGERKCKESLERTRRKPC